MTVRGARRLLRHANVAAAATTREGQAGRGRARYKHIGRGVQEGLEIGRTENGGGWVRGVMPTQDAARSPNKTRALLALVPAAGAGASLACIRFTSAALRLLK